MYLLSVVHPCPVLLVGSEVLKKPRVIVWTVLKVFEFEG